MKTWIKFYCGCCGEYSPVKIEPLRTDELNKPVIWSDVVCVECHFVIATISASEPGVYQFVKVEDS